MTPYEMFLINLPYSDLETPYTAPALLKGIAEAHNYEIHTHDFNIDLKTKICKNNQDLFMDVQESFISTGGTAKTENIARSFYDHVIDKIEKTPARYLGISVFSVYTHKATMDICKILRRKLPDIKIVLGGRGLNVRSHRRLKDQLIEDDYKNKKFSDIMLENNLCDELIIGDAEDALIELFSGQKSSDQMKWYVAASNNLDYPFANFDDYKMDAYTGVAGKPQMHVISSKGCVRACDFCDVGHQFKKFRNKDGKRFAEEIIFLAEKYNIREFATADSILNGNMVALKQTIEVLADYNSKQSEDKKIRWGGNWICRPPGRVPPEFFDKMAQAGCLHLNIGAEHGSNNVLKAMNKKTNVEGLYYELQHMSRTGVQCALNNVVGHWSETHDDWIDHIKMFIKIAPYVANRTVTKLYVGSGFSVLYDTPAQINAKKNGLVYRDGNFTSTWYCKTNPNLTFKARLARLMVMYYICLKLHLPVSYARNSLIQIHRRMNDPSGEGLQWLAEQVDLGRLQTCESILYLSDEDSIQRLLDSIINDNFQKTSVNVALDSEDCRGSPGIRVVANGKEIYSSILPEGKHNLQMEFDNEEHNSITLEMYNKSMKDTEVDADGTITKDKCIKFKSLVVDGVDLLKDQHYYVHNTVYKQSGETLSRSISGLFMPNSSLTIDFEGVFWRDFIPQMYESKQQDGLENCESIINDIKELALSMPY